MYNSDLGQVQSDLQIYHRNAFIDIHTPRTVENLMWMWIAWVCSNVICHHDNDVLIWQATMSQYLVSLQV